MSLMRRDGLAIDVSSIVMETCFASSRGMLVAHPEMAKGIAKAKKRRERRGNGPALTAFKVFIEGYRPVVWTAAFSSKNSAAAFVLLSPACDTFTPRVLIPISWAFVLT